VMLDAEGPGAVVRIWSANPAGVLRFYLDGAEAPALAEDMKALLTGAGPVKAPLSENTSNGCSLYLPIPYAKRCVVTCDAPNDVYYHVEHRDYAAGTNVVSFQRSDLEKHADAIDAVNRAWTHPGEGSDDLGAVAFTYSLARNNTVGEIV